MNSRSHNEAYIELMTTYLKWSKFMQLELMNECLRFQRVIGDRSLVRVTLSPTASSGRSPRAHWSVFCWWWWVGNSLLHSLIVKMMFGDFFFWWWEGSLLHTLVMMMMIDVFRSCTWVRVTPWTWGWLKEELFIFSPSPSISPALIISWSNMNHMKKKRSGFF